MAYSLPVKDFTHVHNRFLYKCPKKRAAAFFRYIYIKVIYQNKIKLSN